MNNMVAGIPKMNFNQLQQEAMLLMLGGMSV
jgi:hypothetical protein